MSKRINACIIKTYNKLIGTKIINKNNKISRKLRSMLFHNICRECYASFGKENPCRKFYLIRCPQAEMGLWAIINYVIYHIEKAIEMEREPVVDWQYYPNNYFSEDDEVGKINVWNCFFEPLCDVSLEQLYKSKDVLMSSGSWDASNKDMFDDSFRQKKHETVEKYLKLTDDLKKRLDIHKKELGFDRYRILGVKCRGTDFVAAKPEGHAVVPDNNTTISTIEKCMQEWGEFDRIFLCTEDESILKEMKSYFGEKLLFLDINRITLDNSIWLSEVFDGQKTKVSDMKDYLMETYLLSACSSLIAPHVGGTIGAIRIRGYYENMFIFNLGDY